MNTCRAFCENCRCDVKYSILEKELYGTLKGKRYFYNGKEAICIKCNSPLFVPEINDYNLKSLYDVYRDKNGLVSLEIINEIPKKYQIGKRPLSILLGWGELTYTRYCNGDVPSRQYSDILKKIWDDPSFYLDILEENKDRLNSNHAYIKSYKATNELLNTNKVSQSKIDQSIEYILFKCEDITPLALQKALYYIQGFYYAFYGNYLFTEDCRAWIHGPVYKEIYLKYKNYQFYPIDKTKLNYDGTFSNEEIAILDSVSKYICCYSGKVLENFTHNEDPWLKTRGELPNNVDSEKIIDKQLIGDYFKSIKDKYLMKCPDDISEYTKEMFAKYF